MLEESYIRFAESFGTWITHSQSMGRFGLECVVHVTDPARPESWFLLSEVAACQMYQKTGILHQPPYLYLALFGPEQHKIWRTHAPLRQLDSVARHEQTFESFRTHLETCGGVLMDTDQALRRAVENNQGLNCRAQLEEAPEITLEFPVKHINIDLTSGMFQAETGLIALPREGASLPLTGESFEVGFCAMNGRSSMEFSAYHEQTSASEERYRFLGKSRVIGASLQLIARERGVTAHLKGSAPMARKASTEKIEHPLLGPDQISP